MSTVKLVTIKDVARESGVSIGAVSKVLHGRGGNIRVSEATAARIRDAAKALNYRPNYHARSLRSGRSRSIGLVMNPVSNIDDRGLVHAHLLDGLIAALAARGYSLNVSPELLPLESTDPLTDGRFDGLVWVDSQVQGSVADTFVNSPIPAVAIGGRYDAGAGGVACFLIDEDAGFDRLLEHLKEHGHRSVGYLDRRQPGPSPVAESRREALARAVGRSGVSLTDFGTAAPEEVLARWETEGRKPTAFIAWNDRRASEFLAAIEARGLAMPDDLSLAACDGTVSAHWAWPRLTTLQTPLGRMIEDAVESLMGQIERTSEPVLRPRYAPELDVRGSTGPSPDLRRAA